MGCGCGRKATSRVGAAPKTVPTTTNMNKTDAAKTFQSATMQRAPTGPVGGVRKTV